MKGLTNLIKFDNQGFRSDFILDIIELSSSGIRKVGDWNSTQGVNFTRSFRDQQQDMVENLKNKTLIVTALLVSVNKIHFCHSFFLNINLILFSFFFLIQE